MIELPNIFKGKSYIYKITLQKPMDINSVLPYQVINTFFKKQFNSIVDLELVFSDMSSTINKLESINFIEIILRVVIEYKGQYFYYPLLTVVNNIFSLKRGEKLGFYKLLDNNLGLINNKLLFTNKFLNINLLLPKNNGMNLKNIDSFPYILEKRGGVRVLKVENYELDFLEEIPLDNKEKIRIFNQLCDIKFKYMKKDRFELLGVILDI